MKAYTGPVTKEEFIKELEWHREKDAFLKGTYGKIDGGEFKGCAVGCSINGLNRLKRLSLDTGDHSVYEKMLGIPEWLARVEDAIFEGLPTEESRDWPLRFSRAIKVGAELDKIKPAFLIYILESNLERLKDDKFKEQREAVEGCIALWSRDDIGTSEWKSAARSAAWSAAESAARSAAESAAESAARSAAWSAESAAWSAAWSAARSAESAAESAARSAARSAESAAESAAFIKFAEKLIELIEGCEGSQPVKTEINWPEEFERFMAEQPDYEGVPVWDRWLWWAHKASGAHLTLEHCEPEYYVSGAFGWRGEDAEGFLFWQSLSRKWIIRVGQLGG